MIGRFSRMTWRIAPIAVAGLLAAASALAEEPAALILELSGNTIPALTPYTEIKSGTTVALAPQTRLRFVHYRSCRNVRVYGGRLTLNPEGYVLHGGETEFDRAHSCPKRLSAGANSGTAGGLVLRSGLASVLALSSKPSVVFAGTRAADVARVQLTASDGRAASLMREGNEPVWHGSAPPGNYSLIAVAADGRLLANHPVHVLSGDDPSDAAIVRLE